MHTSALIKIDEQNNGSTGELFTFAIGLLSLFVMCVRHHQCE